MARLLSALAVALAAVGAAAQTNNGVQYVSANTGDDVCLNISNAMALLPRSGGTVDARSVAGIVRCGTNPFSSSNAQLGGILLLLGPATFETSVPWVIPQMTVVRGLGRGGAPPVNPFGRGTAILASNPALPFVIQLGITPNGSAGAVHGSRIEDLNVDCGVSPGGNTGLGVYSNSINEQSGIFNVKVSHCGYRGILIDASQPPNTFAQNYSIAYVEIQAMNANRPGQGIGIHLLGNSDGPQTVHDVTVTATSTNLLDTCVQIENLVGGVFFGIHGEGCKRAVNIGGAGTFAVQGVSIAGISGGPNVETVVQINNTQTGSLTLEAVQNYLHSAVCTIRDFRNNISLRNHTVGLYSFGDSGDRILTTSTQLAACP